MFSAWLGKNRTWDSIASRCPTSGAIVHFLSLKKTESTVEDSKREISGTNLSLLAITAGIKEEENENLDSGVDDAIHWEAMASVMKSRQILASHFEHTFGNGMYATAQVLRLIALQMANRPLNPSHLLGWSHGLPLLQFPPRSNRSNFASKDQTVQCQKGLREIVLPHFHDAYYDNGLTLPLCLSQSNAFLRPLVGLYQWPKSNDAEENKGGIILRPLPAADKDMHLSPPSLVFGCSNLDSVAEVINGLGARSTPVGFSGRQGRHGQLLVTHPTLRGLDMRACESSTLSTAFAEAQESLMAGSIDSLQSVNVLVEGGGDSSHDYHESVTKDSKKSLLADDPLIDKADCWIEFRANAIRPSGYLKQSMASWSSFFFSSAPPKQRYVKAPSIPYE